MNEIPPEIARVRALWKSFTGKDRYWVDVKQGSFHLYTNHGDGHDPFAYMLYSDGRQMEIDVTSWLEHLEDPDLCLTYSQFVEILERLVSEKLPEYEERFALHMKHIKNRCEKLGAPKVYEVSLAIQLWQEQLTLLRNIPSLINMFKRSRTYRAENNLPFEDERSHTTINAQSGATVSNATITGQGNSIIQGSHNQVSISSRDELFTRLQELGISEARIKELEVAMDEDEANRPSGASKSEVGPSVRQWLGDITLELAQQGTAVANGVSGSLIANMLWAFMGLAQ